MQEEIVSIETEEVSRGALVRREDGSIALPETETLPAKSEEAMLASVENLPDDLEPVVKTVLQARHSSYSYLQLLLLGVFLAGALLLTYWCLPHPVDVGELSMFVEGDKLQPPSQAKALAVASQAGKLFQERKFAECARLLFQTPGAMEEPWLASIFCEAVYEIPQDSNWKQYRETARKTLDRLAGQYPDDVRWLLQRIKIESRLCFLKDDFHLMAPDRPRITKIAVLLHDIPNVRRLDRRTGRKNRLVIDLLEAKLLTATWLLKGFSQGYPDNQGDIGVEEREEAYQIASRHYDTRDFLELRRKIVLKIQEGDSKMNSYYFKRRSRYSRRYLEEELAAIDNALSRSGKDE